MVLSKTSKTKIKSTIFPRKRQIYKLLQKALALVEAIAAALLVEAIAAALLVEAIAAALLQAVLMSAGSQVALAPALGIQI